MNVLGCRQSGMVSPTRAVRRSWERRRKMSGCSDHCSCGGPDRGEKDDMGGLCPVCGKRMNKVEALSDSLIEATFEVLAEERAIWSGAR